LKEDQVIKNGVAAVIQVSTTILKLELAISWQLVVIMPTLTLTVMNGFVYAKMTVMQLENLADLSQSAHKILNLT